MCVNDASRIVIDNSRAMLQMVASLADNFIGNIFNCNMFIVQAIDAYAKAATILPRDSVNHTYRKCLNRLLKVCYVPSTSTVLIAFFSSFFAAAINSTNEANKAAGSRL